MSATGHTIIDDTSAPKDPVLAKISKNLSLQVMNAIDELKGKVQYRAHGTLAVDGENRKVCYFVAAVIMKARDDDDSPIDPWHLGEAASKVLNSVLHGGSDG